MKKLFSRFNAPTPWGERAAAAAVTVLLVVSVEIYCCGSRINDLCDPVSLRLLRLLLRLRFRLLYSLGSRSLRGRLRCCCRSILGCGHLYIVIEVLHLYRILASHIMTILHQAYGVLRHLCRKFRAIADYQQIVHGDIEAIRS